ncbi:MAG: DUF4126 domain-containing protein [Phycisphaerales bacterium]|nr:DUF4126 domain-containing protein [Phycisphaerales bacterium]
MDFSTINPVHLLSATIMGIALSAACGLRVFVPLLTLALGARWGLVSLGSEFEWLGSGVAIATLTLACVVEVLSASIPLVDHALDLIAAPMALVAGTVVMAAQLGFVPQGSPEGQEMSPLVMWTCSVVVGGGTAIGVHSLAALLRVGSTVTTLGIANPVMAAVETTGSFLTSVTALVFPLCGLMLVIVAAVPLSLLALRILRKRRTAPLPQ